MWTMALVRIDSRNILAAMTTRMRATAPTLVHCSTALLETLFRQARSAHGEECCGALIGERHTRTITDIVPLPNAAPDPRCAYAISPRVLLELELRLPVLGFYHSHPDGSSTPSSWDGDAAWPGYLYAIVGREVRVWRWEDPAVSRGTPTRYGFRELKLVAER